MDRLSDYDYELPDELIAQAPIEPRDHSRLMVVDQALGTIEHHRFDDLPKLVAPHTLFVANNTRVIRARLLGNRVGSGSGKVEFLLLERKGPGVWEGLMKSGSRVRPDFEFEVYGIRARVLSVDGSGIGSVTAEFSRDPADAQVGEWPLPPYITRADPGAAQNYQTVYSKEEGSAAAPTAGLHFTPEVLERLRTQAHAQWAEVTLHVGVGTFRPVKAEIVAEHVMHEERYAITPGAAQTINAHLNAARAPLLAVGTTSVRTLESAVTGWPPRIRAGEGRTRLFLRPGGEASIQVVDQMLTNFHLPRSTLLMLVSAFVGRDLILSAYREAVARRYRFFSYGDAMLLKRRPQDRD